MLLKKERCSIMMMCAVYVNVIISLILTYSLGTHTVKLNEKEINLTLTNIRREYIFYSLNQSM